MSTILQEESNSRTSSKSFPREHVHFRLDPRVVRENSNDSKLKFLIKVCFFSNIRGGRF